MPVKGKRPVPAGATGKNGIVDEAAIVGWTRDPEWAGQNTAVRHHLTMGIDVDHYGEKNGGDQLALLEAKLGPLPATPSTTARGGDSLSRQHVFALREPVEMYGKPPIEGLKGPDIHIEIIQAHHRYTVCWPSTNPDADDAPYLWYDAEGDVMDGPPSVDDLEYLPEAWLEYLAVGEREFAHGGAQYDGEIPEVASQTEERKLRAIITSLDGLPEVWAPGAGWHDTVFAAACWLWRIARSNAYALTPDQGLQLMLDHTPTYPSWGVENIMVQWESADTSTAGQFEEPPAEDRPPLLAWTGFPTDRAFPSVNGENFAFLWGTLPDNTTESGLWARRQDLLRALLQSGFTDQEAATVIWHCAAARHPGITFEGQVYADADSRLVTDSGIWREVDQAKGKVEEAAGSSVEAAPADERPSTTATVHHEALLSAAEREYVVSKECEWFGTRFIDWAEATFSSVNHPYYRLNRWMILSVIFSPKAVLPRPGGNDRPINLYMALVGKTTSGKTEALRVGKHVFKAYYLLADSPDIGGNHTPEALVETLINRDGLSSWFHIDEAHTKIAVWKKPQGPYSEMPGVITDVYDGDVSAIFRATKKDISGKHAQAFVTAHFMGTPQGMADVMGPEDWESGFLNRFVWAIGDDPVDTIDSVAGDWLLSEDLDEDSAEVESGSKMYQQWAAQFGNAVQKVSRPDGKPARMRLTREVVERHRQLAWDLNQLAARRTQYTERLRPTFRRLGESTFRAAALVALSEGRTNITLRDMLIAIEQTEEWVQNILVMVEATDESLRTREVNAIENAVLINGGTMTLASIHRLPRFRNRRREVEDLIAELVAQGRAQRDKDTNGIDTVKTKGVLS